MQAGGARGGRFPTFLGDTGDTMSHEKMIPLVDWLAGLFLQNYLVSVGDSEKPQGFCVFIRNFFRLNGDDETTKFASGSFNTTCF